MYGCCTNQATKGIVYGCCTYQASKGIVYGCCTYQATKGIVHGCYTNHGLFMLLTNPSTSIKGASRFKVKKLRKKQSQERSIKLQRGGSAAPMGPRGWPKPPPYHHWGWFRPPPWLYGGGSSHPRFFFGKYIYIF